jgi:hypothetical protein
MSDKQDIVPVTLKSESQQQMHNQKTQTKSTVAFQVTKESTTYRIYVYIMVLINTSCIPC